METLINTETNSFSLPSNLLALFWNFQVANGTLNNVITILMSSDIIENCIYKHGDKGLPVGDKGLPVINTVAYDVI